MHSKFAAAYARGTSLYLCLALTSLGVAGVAHAQEAGAAEQAQQPAIDADNRLDVVVVTAQRRSENVQEVPASITALDAQMLETRGISDVASLQFAVPNLSLGRSLGTTQIAIRGVGRTSGDPAVAINIDGVYQPRNTPMVIGEIDLDRVEVLRGPQGTLYGRNANGGAVNFITAAPDSTRGGHARIGIANYGRHKIETMLNLPVTDNVSTRLVLNYDKRDEGYVENVMPGGEDLDTSEVVSGRLRVAADITDDLRLDLAFNAFHGRGRGDYYVPTSLPSAAGIAINPIIATAVVPLEYNKTSALGETGSERAFQQVSATLDWSLPLFDVKSITAYQRMDNKWDMDRDGTDIALVDAHADEHSETFSQEFDLSGDIGSVDWVGGLYYFDDSFSQTTFYAFALGFAPLPPNSYLVQHMPISKAKTSAAFADLTWNVSDAFRVIGGARQSRDELEVVHRNFFGNLATGAVIADTCPEQRDDLQFNSTTYRIGGQYDVGDQQQVYGMVSTGFKAGGVNFSGCNNTFRPETITSYETGFKGTLFDNSVIFNASAFYYDYTDFQLREVVGVAARVTNAASATVQGIELEGQWAPDDHWSFNASLSLLEAKYGDFNNTDSLNVALGPQNLNGRYLSNAPRSSGSVGVAYRTGVQDYGELTARMDASYRSRVYFREFNSPLESQDAYTVVNANLIWDSVDGNYSARLYADNLFDEGYWVAMLAVEGFGARAGSFGAPREFGIELTARY